MSASSSSVSAAAIGTQWHSLHVTLVDDLRRFDDPSHMDRLLWQIVPQFTHFEHTLQRIHDTIIARVRQQHSLSATHPLPLAWKKLQKWSWTSKRKDAPLAAARQWFEQLKHIATGSSIWLVSAS